MAATLLNISILSSYNVNNFVVLDHSIYGDVLGTPDTDYYNRILKITPPGFNQVEFNNLAAPNDLPPIFPPGEYEVYTSVQLLGSDPTTDPQALPDGIYTLEYGIYLDVPEVLYENTCIKRSIMRIDKIQEKFDNVFMTLDMMECDRAIKAQAKVELSSIYFFIQGAVSAANNCAVIQSEKLYQKADQMLDRFLNNNCGCSGTLYSY
jgi:hypothetical protein